MTQADRIIERLSKEIEGFKDDVSTENVGTILEVGDGIAKVAGLDDLAASEIVSIETSKGEEISGLALNLEEDEVGIVVFGDYKKISEGDIARSTGEILSVPVGDAMIGRTVDALLNPIDGKGEIKTSQKNPVEKVAPGVMTREPVNQPLQTGIKAIDAMVPIGRGQRELIIGDRQTGKTAVAIDTIINQKGENIKCIYVAIGQRESKIRKITKKLEEAGAMEYTTVILAGSSSSAAMNFLAPYSGAALSEYFMSKGEDVLIVYDDLSKHAMAYRQMSLLLKRPPGREAYPGDVFYLHSRLLERSARLNEANGGGSVTALPIIETQAGDVSAYIPTNVISITDGQIYLESGLFNKGIRPAINAGLSVSRVGSSAQTKIIKKLAGTLRLDLAQYRELEAFAAFGSDVDEETKKKLERGKRTVEVLKQGQYKPLSVAQQAIIIFAVTNGFTDDVEVDKIVEWEEGLHNFVNNSHSDLVEEINTEKTISDEIKERMKNAIEEYKEMV